MENYKKEKRFRKVILITIVAVYFLILVGGIVRSTGSGLGCPDWPKCFGKWVPPTDVSELPSNYKEIFKIQGKQIADFDAFKTWVEYINRLIGVIIGFLIFLTLIMALPYRKKDKTIFYCAILSFVLVAFQGWLGAVVVSTHLANWMVTLHMLMALLIVSLLIYILFRSRKSLFEGMQAPRSLSWLILIALGLTVIQIILGTQVRENIDLIAQKALNRSSWIDQLDGVYYAHRTFSWILLLFNLFVIYQISRKMQKTKWLKISLLTLFTAIMLELAAGIGMAYFGLPPFLQPIHLIIASIIFGIQFFLFLYFRWIHLKNAADNTFNVA